MPLRDAAGAVTHAVAASVRTAALDDLLRAMPLPADGIAAVTDPWRVIVARSRDAERWIAPTVPCCAPSRQARTGS